ncbi:MAG: hypothetical protein NWE94_07235 [Candidatus Bathyarchaeota archaeon]|nr:hypothetical protein [Candidatus Bathyarchaeota archaeon]
MKTNNLNWLVLLTQATGATAFAIFIASYALALPTNQVLHGEPIFRIPLQIFGGIFLILTITTLIASFITKPKKQAQNAPAATPRCA